MTKMGKTQRELSWLRKNVRAARKDIDRIMSILEREKRIDHLIAEMKQTARQMLQMSHEL